MHHSDLRWWHLFMSTWNGVSELYGLFSPDTLCRLPPNHNCYRCFRVLGLWYSIETQWFQLAWSTEWTRMDIMAKELVPIVLSCAVWGPLILQKKLEFRCDNHSLVDAINKGSSKNLWSCISCGASGFSQLSSKPALRHLTSQV